jgi:hypothetical protein
MIKIIQLKNGQLIGYKIAEITSVPYFELYDKNVDRANYMNQVFFTQLITGLHMRAELNNTAFEILSVSVEVNNQTYKAQVKIHIILRYMGTDRNQIERSISDTVQSLKNDFEQKNFAIHFFESEEEMGEFKNTMSAVSTSKVLAVAKKERAVTNALSANGCLYYTDVVEPSENINMTAITNVMTQYPNSAVSVQLIPTKYTPQEIIAIEESKSYLNYYATNLRFRQGIRLDANTQSILDSYEYYSNAEKEPLFYFNFIVYSQPNSAFDLANKVMNVVEAEGKATGSSLEIIDLSEYGLNPAKSLPVSPWVISDILVFKQRERAFWNSKGAPQHLIRLKYLMTAREVRTVFKAPIDDGKAIGLDSKKVLSNRERLDQSVISDNNFKVGIIQNASRTGQGSYAHAGIALNDFTKHGLIVGMPGSGKTNFSLGLLLQFWKDFKIPFLAIEPTKSEYRSLIDDIKDLQIFTPGKNNISPYIINPFIPPKGVTVESYVPSLMTAFKAAFSMPNPLPDIFLAAINDCYNEYGWKSTSTTDDPYIEPFGLYEFIKVFKRKIQNIDYKGEVKSNIESAGVVRLVSLIEQNSNIYDTIHTIPIEDLLSKPTVIELNAINNKEQKSLIMALLLILICVYTKNNVAGDGKLKNVMLIDEAHVLLAGSSVKSEDSADSQGSTVEALEDLIAEIRSYGTSIIIADQSPTKVGRSIIANTNVKLIFKLVEKENKDAISTATNMNEADYDLLGRLGVGEAMLHYGRIYYPLHIKTYNVLDRADIRPVITDKEVAEMSKYWRDRGELLVPHRECKFNCICKNKCDLTVRADADFLASRLINSNFYEIPDKKAFVKFLVNMSAPINKLLKENPSIESSLQLINCTKVKFLRKSLLIKSFDITKAEYQIILRHRHFLKQL